MKKFLLPFILLNIYTASHCCQCTTQNRPGPDRTSCCRENKCSCKSCNCACKCPSSCSCTCCCQPKQADKSTQKPTQKNAE